MSHNINSENKNPVPFWGRIFYLKGMKIMPRLKKNYTPRELQESRCFLSLIYPDSETYDYQIILNRLPYYWDNFYYILHDKDVYLELDYDKYISENGHEPEWKIGDLKKPHYHLIGYCSPTTLGRAASKFGLPSNYVQIAEKSLKDNIIYLIHRKEPWKYQYQEEEIITNDGEISTKLRVKVDTEEKAAMLLEAIFSSEICTISELSKYAIQNHCWDELRRGQHIYCSLLKEKTYFAKQEYMEKLNENHDRGN